MTPGDSLLKALANVKDADSGALRELALLLDADHGETHRARERAGLWTPALDGSSTAGAYTYTAQAGYWTVQGRVCHINFRIVISAIGTPPVGTMRIVGLPYTAAALADLRSVIPLRKSNLDYPAGALEIYGQIFDNENSIRLRYSVDNAADVEYPAANFTNAACAINGSGFYLI